MSGNHPPNTHRRTHKSKRVGAEDGARYEIRLSGSGGQGMIFAGTVLAEAMGVEEGKNVCQTQSYGPEARGGASRSDLVVSQGEIYYPKPLKLAKLLWGRDGLDEREMEGESFRLREQRDIVEELSGGDHQVLEDIFYNNAVRFLRLDSLDTFAERDVSDDA